MIDFYWKWWIWLKMVELFVENDECWLKMADTLFFNVEFSVKMMDFWLEKKNFSAEPWKLVEESMQIQAKSMPGGGMENSFLHENGWCFFENERNCLERKAFQRKFWTFSWKWMIVCENYGRLGILIESDEFLVELNWILSKIYTNQLLKSQY